LQSIFDLDILATNIMKFLLLSILLLVNIVFSLQAQQKVNGYSVNEDENPFRQNRAACTTKTACTAKGGTCRKKKKNCTGLYVQVSQGCSSGCQCCIPDCTTSTSTCPSGFTLTNSQCLSFQTSSATWSNAQLACQRLGGRLAKAKDTSTLATYLQTNYAGQNFWMGASDSHSEGEWLWTSGGTVDSGIWYSGEPNNAGGGSGEDCMLWWGSDIYGYIDEPCTESFNYICEADLA
ncbi:unnamed protein product, partial [Meganyctiphanes norvegica]